MGNFFGKANNNVQLSQHEILRNKYNSSRANLMIAIIFTLVNIGLALCGGDSYFLFSIYVPYIIAFTGLLLTGNLAKDFYTDEFANLEPFPNGVLAVALGIAAVILIVYLLCYLFSSKNRVGWVIAGLVFVSADTVAMLFINGIIPDVIVDIAFHVWLIISLSSGIRAHFKLKNLPEEEIYVAPALEESAPLRMADLDAKAKILAEAEQDGFAVVYRRVGKVNELVVNGNVYDQYEAVIENVHNLVAHIGGRTIEAGYDGFRSFIKIDGEVIVKKTRLV